MIETLLECISEICGLPEYDPDRFGESGDTRMLEIEQLPLEERVSAIYGVAAD